MGIPALLGGSRRRSFALLIGNALLQSTVLLWLARSVGGAVDHVLPALTSSQSSQQPQLQATLPVLALPLLLAMGVALLRWRERYDAEALAQAYVHRIRRALLEHLQRAQPAALRQRSRGGLLLRFVGDMSAIGNWVSRGYARLATLTITLLGVGTGLFLTAPQYVLLVPVLALPALLAMAAVSGRLDTALTALRDERARLASRVSEHLSAVETLQLRGDGAREVRRILQHSDRVRLAAMRTAVLVGLVEACTEALSHAAPLMLIFGAGLLSLGHAPASAGEVAALLSLAGMLSAPLRDLGKVQVLARRARLSRRKLAVLLAMPRVKDRGRQQLPSQGPLRLQIEDFRPADAGASLSVEVAAGSRLRIAGLSAAPCSPLTSALLRLDEPFHGAICIDSHRLESIALESLRARVSVVSAEVPLLRGSAERNLPQGSRESASSAVASLIESLPEGWRTRLGERASNLSGAERLRLSLARALATEPGLLVIDSVELPADEFTRAAMLRAISQCPGTVVVVSDDPAWDRALSRCVSPSLAAASSATEGFKS